jgi:hypothetical protein
VLARLRSIKQDSQKRVVLRRLRFFWIYRIPLESFAVIIVRILRISLWTHTGCSYLYRR